MTDTCYLKYSSLAVLPSTAGIMTAGSSISPSDSLLTAERDEAVEVSLSVSNKR